MFERPNILTMAGNVPGNQPRAPLLPADHPAEQWVRCLPAAWSAANGPLRQRLPSQTAAFAPRPETT